MNIKYTTFGHSSKYPQGYLRGVREIADKYNILLIIDEVMMGFGRCGKWFAVENSGIVPDIITMAKGITSGYVPLGGVTILNENILDYLDNNVFPYGLTYGAHPVSCAAAIANLDVLEEKGLLENSNKIGDFAYQYLLEKQGDHPLFGDIRMTGLLGVLEIVKNKKTKEPMAPWNAKPSEMAVMNKVFSKLRDSGLYTFARFNHIFIAPPLTISKSQMKEEL